MPTMFFFMLVTRGPQGTVGQVVAPEPSHWGGRVWSRRTHGSAGALSRREVESGAMTHVVAPEPSLAGRWGLEPLDTWQHRSPHWQ
jgi:hypothetical protein